MTSNFLENVQHPLLVQAVTRYVLHGEFWHFLEIRNLFLELTIYLKI